MNCGKQCRRLMMKRIISAMVIILMLSLTTMVYAEEKEPAD